MKESRKMTNIAIVAALQHAMMESVNYDKFQAELKRIFNVDMSAEEYKKMTSFYHLTRRIESEYLQKTL